MTNVSIGGTSFPSDWEIETLGDAVSFLDGDRRPVKSSDRQKMKGTYPYYGASGIVDYVNDYLFDDDLILLGEDGENILSRNLPLAFQVSGKIWVNNHAHVLKPSSDYNIVFLTAYLESLDYSGYNSGTAQPKLNKKTCEGVEVVKPPLSEQDAISVALSDVDSLIKALERLITKKRDIKIATMQELLTGHARLPGFNGDWKWQAIKDVCVIKTGSKNTQDKVANGKYPFFVRSQTVEKINSYSYDCEAILTAGDGVGTGKVFHYVNGKFDSHQRVYILSGFSSHINGYFLYKYFSENFYDRIMSMTAKSSVDSVRMEMIADMMVPVPAIKEQEAISSVLRDIDDELLMLEKRLDKTREIKQGMIQELMTGKTRLVSK